MGSIVSDGSHTSRLLSVEEVSRRLGLKRQTIYNQISQRLFPIKHKKIGRLIRFDSKEVEAYLHRLSSHY